MIKQRRGQIHPYRLLFWSVAMLIGIVALLDRFPFTLDAGDPRVEGQTQPVESNGDVLVVLSETAIVRATSAGRFEASWTWVDIIRSEVGPVTALDVEALDAETIQEHRVVVLTGSASADSNIDDLVDELRAFATNGGVLVLELPQGALRDTFGADGQGGWRQPNEITAVEGVSEEIAQSMMEIPLATRFMGSTRPLEGAETMLAMDGAPVIYNQRIGSGEVIVFDFDVGAQISSLQQGLPGPDGRVRPRSTGQPVRTSDLIASSSMLGSTLPYADLLERYIVHAAISHRHPLFALWPYPEGAPGALITSHDTRRVDGRPLWMSIHERELDARSATFILAPSDLPPDEHVPEDAELVGHGALLWMLDGGETDLYRRWGLFGFEPVRQPLTLVGQLEHLELWLGDEADIRGVRIWDGRWSEFFTDAYRVMDAVQLRYSVSYGPAPGLPHGALFGTCQPFRPIDVNGLPFGIEEVPICFDNPQSEEERQLLREALETAREHAYAVHLLTSSDRFSEAPNMAGFDAWRDSLEFAERNEMWVGGAGELVSFWDRRAAAELRVIGSDVSSRDNDGNPREVEYTVEAETGARGLVLMVPSEFDGLTLERATRGAQQAQVTALGDQVSTQTVTYLGREFSLIPLNPGFTTVGLRYER